MDLLRQPDKNRLLAALNHEKGDRVPNFEILIDNKACRQFLGLGANGEKVTSWTLPPAQVVKLMEQVGQDAVACSLTWLGTEEGSILSHDDFDQVVAPDPAKARETMKPWIDAVSGTGMGLCARLSGPLTLTYMAAGPVPIQSFMYMLYDEPDLVERMMDCYTDYHLSMMDAIADLPLDFFYIGDDVSSSTGSMISPEHIERLWAPRTEKLVRRAQDMGKPVIFHCCGMQAPILPYLMEWGVNAVHPIQPEANDIHAMKKEHGTQLTLVGNIDVAAELSFGSEEDTRRSVREHIDQLADGSYVVCSSHSIIDSVKPENYLAMCDETQRYGVYA